MAKVSLNRVEKIYPNGFKALHGIDLTIADGELVVLVGPSGCGKSTLLRMIAGLEEVTAGDIDIGNRQVNRLEPAERDIAMVFQNYALYPHMSVYDNMAYGLRNRRTPAEEIDRRVQQAAEILELSGLLQRKPRQLSGGQRQRVAMGRAIVREPAVFLFDEPLSNLDAKLRVQMRLEIKRLQHRLRTTSIYVTHDQVEAMTLADRLVVMNAGIAEQVGTPLEVYDRPATQFVAGFIGSPAMNFLPGRMTDRGDAVIVNGGSAFPVDHRLPAGQAVTVGMRPEHLQPAGADQPQFAATVELSEDLGSESLAHLRLQGVSETITLRQPGTALAAGQALHLTITKEHIHLFDPESGRRL